MITTKTGDRLMCRAHELTAIADALDEAGMRSAADAVTAAATLLATAGQEIKIRADRYARAAEAE